jgi:hypothetical protein
VQLDQFVRRAVWRARRRFESGVDHAPIVTVEMRAPPPVSVRRGRMRLLSALLAALGAALVLYGVLAAAP